MLDMIYFFSENTTMWLYFARNLRDQIKEISFARFRVGKRLEATRSYRNVKGMTTGGRVRYE